MPPIQYHVSLTLKYCYSLELFRYKPNVVSRSHGSAQTRIAYCNLILVFKPDLSANHHQLHVIGQVWNPIFSTGHWAYCQALPTLWSLSVVKKPMCKISISVSDEREGTNLALNVLLNGSVLRVLFSPFAEGKQNVLFVSLPLLKLFKTWNAVTHSDSNFTIMN